MPRWAGSRFRRRLCWPLRSGTRTDHYLLVLGVAPHCSFGCIFESVWFRRMEHEQRAVAIDWLFVVAYLVVWAFEMVRVILAGLMASLWV